MAMRKIFLSMMLAGGFGVAAIADPPTPAPAPQPVNPPRTEVRPTDTAPMQTFRVKQVLGSKVSVQDNISVGTVEDVVFRTDGMIEYLIVDNGGKLTTVPWEAAKFDYDKRIATVHITNDVYTTIPTYTVKEYPAFHTPTYQTEIYRYYKLNPRQERRIERRNP